MQGQIVRLELQLLDVNNTRKQRRHLQNKRNRLKQKIFSIQKVKGSAQLIDDLKIKEKNLKMLEQLNRKFREEGEELQKDN